ncbi:hypothetical protein [Desulfovibrio sp. JC022]|uniref:hypothetical protein n=1 Tax=Desulfovibrio sp. JC022 TaxID=2593642 RepID=UPI00193EF084|nr:hypothetical protein [Desulfovibrio sp. JC022]
MIDKLGNWFETQRTQNMKFWKILFAGFLVLLVVLNFFIHPHHVEYYYDGYPGFWEIFALVASVGMVFLMKVLIQPFLVGPEEGEDYTEGGNNDH